MKVIKSRVVTQKDEPKRCICEECESELEYTEDDTHVGWLGFAYVTCPVCGEETMVGEERECPPMWPATFHHVSSANAYEVSVDTITGMVDDVVNALTGSDEIPDFASQACGDAMVWGWKHLDGIDVYVTQDYWTDTILPED